MSTPIPLQIAADVPQLNQIRPPSGGATKRPTHALQTPTGPRATASVLSHENGKFPAPEDTQKLLCFLDNGELLIIHRKRLDPLVQEYELRLRRAGRQFIVVETELDELKALYRRTVVEASEVRTDKDDSTRQRQIMAMIRDAASHNASDIHAYEGRNIGEIRFRINGRLETLPGYQMEPEEVNAIIATIYNSMIEVGGNATYFQPGAPQDGRIRQEFLDEDTLSGVRCATRPKDRGMIGIFRLLYAHKGVKSLPSLGYLPEQVIVWTRLLRRRVGMNILSGPTGSGKSTTLSTIFAMQVDYFQRQMHILTAEDPVEYEIPGVNHTNVDRDSSNNPAWAKSIKNMMRLDPDIAGVGEMRDHDSAVAAFALATTGHGTYSTLHANDGFAIIQRLLDLNVDPGLIYDPAVLTGMINQGLAPTICPNCRVPWSKRPDTYDKELAERVEATIDDTSGVHVGVGCEKCRFTGAAGRTVVAEVIETNLDLMRTLRTAGAAEARALWVRKYHGITKSMHIIQRVREGLIDPAHAEAVIGMPIDEDARTIVVA